jgi:hypothetical protein
MRHSLRTGLAAAGVVLLIAAGCGGDDDDKPVALEDIDEPAGGATTTEADTGGSAAYCSAELAMETLQEPDYRIASDAEVNAWLGGELLPLVEAAAEAAPSEIADDFATMAGAVSQAASDGDFSVFGDPEVDAAEATVHAFDMDSCGWTAQDLKTTEYSFGSIPAELPAGPISFEFDNVGSEVHEMLLAKKNPGVTESVEEIVAMQEEEALSKITAYAHVSGNPGETDYTIADLTPGDWVMICFVPTGLTDGDQEPVPDGPPHYTHGMVAEFTVS